MREPLLNHDMKTELHRMSALCDAVVRSRQLRHVAVHQAVPDEDAPDLLAPRYELIAEWKDGVCTPGDFNMPTRRTR